jgi:hypothetical protein
MRGNCAVKPDVVAAKKAEAETQMRADQKWRPKLKLLRAELEAKSAERQAKAVDELRSITAPRAVPMISAVLLRGGSAS